MKNYRKFLLGSSCMAMMLASGVPAVSAQDASSEGELEEVIVTGSRRAARSAADNPAPVDVIGAGDFKNHGDGDMTNLLRNLVPSYNVNAQPISDAATLVRPANLRGLAPDQTLVLVNGKRRHRAAVIAFLGGGLSDGAQGPDISTIPAIALKQVEVLRDGAAAQYGSDAIAGVMNFILNDASEGGSIEAKWGQTYDGDGDQRQISANIGFPVTDSGFFNISGEWREAEPTNRSVQRRDAKNLIAAGNSNVRQPYAQIWGAPEVRDDWKVFMNFGVDASDSSEVYAFGNYAEREVEGGFFFRNPDTRGGVNSGDGGVSRLVGDLTPGDGMTCPGGINFNEGEMTTGQVVDPLLVGDAAGLAAVFADPNCFVFNEMFPGGFTPQFGGRLNDASIAMGTRGELDSGMTYDVSMHVGRNQADFFIDNTINASLGPATPTTFELGSYIQLEKNFNVDLSYPVDIKGFASPLNIAGGFEWREEQFEARIGQPESFETGILAEITTLNALDSNGDPITRTVNQGFGVGSNGFSGFSPQVAGTNDRTNIAFYLDMEADVTENLVLGAAVRWEDFSDFGSTTNFKLSALYKITDEFAIRSTYSTGFRAPTVGQQQVLNISTVFEEIDGRLELVQRGTIPPTNPIALAVGAEALQPEKSDNFSVGLAWNSDGASLTVDYFNIKLKDRITQSASQSLTDEQRDSLVAQGIGFANDLAAFRFFVNDFDTKTQGIDIVATVPFDVTENGDSALTLAANWTETTVTKFNPVTLDSTRILQLEDNLPKYRANATFTHVEDKWRGLFRVNYYGSYTEAHLDSGGLLINPGAEITLDAQLGYNVMDNLELSIGANNLLNNDPDINPYGGIAGARFPVTSPMGFNGGYYYARAVFTF